MNLLLTVNQILVSLFCLTLYSCTSHLLVNKRHVANNVEKWKKAVIHLECATYSLDAFEEGKKAQDLKNLLKENKISEEEFSRRISDHMDINIVKPYNDIRYHGTAVFLENNKKYYLLTARHVVWDELGAKRMIKNAPDYVDFAQLKRQSLWKIFPFIFRVPSVDEKIDVKSRYAIPYLLMGGETFHKHIFSQPEFDTAVISLNDNTLSENFANDLIERGYRPISINDISSEVPNEGEDIMAVGFPKSTALIKERKQTRDLHEKSSSFYSVPIFSFGKVAMQNTGLPFLWADLSIYPGNSGGPLIYNNKLVGIISAQAAIELDGVDDRIRVRVPFAKVMKAKFLLEIIDIQEKREAGMLNNYNLP